MDKKDEAPKQQRGFSISPGQRFIPQSLNGLSKENQKRLRKMGRMVLGRNSKCPCGSGRRFKRCCMQT